MEWSDCTGNDGICGSDRLGNAPDAGALDRFPFPRIWKLLAEGVDNQAFGGWVVVHEVEWALLNLRQFPRGAGHCRAHRRLRSCIYITGMRLHGAGIPRERLEA